MSYPVTKRFRVTREMADSITRCSQLTGMDHSELGRSAMQREIDTIMKLAEVLSNFDDGEAEMHWKAYAEERKKEGRSTRGREGSKD